jgi:hypothetical protein
LIFTIAGERLELSRLMPPSARARRLFGVLLGIACIGLVGCGEPWGASVFAAALLGLAVWLVRNDIARRTVRQRGLTRFIALCLLSGYAWLALGAAVILDAGGLRPATPAYDAAVHALGLGFVFSMVFGHAPIIFPAVLRVTMPYHPSFYAPLALLHAALALRLIGDAVNRADWVRWGALLAAVALVAFILNSALAAARGRLGARRENPAPSASLAAANRQQLRSPVHMEPEQHGQRSAAQEQRAEEAQEGQGTRQAAGDPAGRDDHDRGSRPTQEEVSRPGRTGGSKST